MVNQNYLIKTKTRGLLLDIYLINWLQVTLNSGACSLAIHHEHVHFHTNNSKAVGGT